MNAKSKIPAILITGATGTIGSELAKQLSLQGISFKALVRSPEKATMLHTIKEAEIVTGDLNDLSSYQESLHGVEKVFLLTNSTEQAQAQQISMIKAAVAAGVKHIVKLSQFAADLHSSVRFLRYHAAVEQEIINSGLDYTFLRPNLFMQALLAFKDLITSKGIFFATAGTAKVSLVDIRDIAAVAVKALTEDGHEGKTYDLTGPQAISHEEIAGYLTAATGKNIQYINITSAEMQESLISFGLPEWQADGLIEDYEHYARGEAAIISQSIEQVTGKPARSFEAFAEDNAKEFGA